MKRATLDRFALEELPEPVAILQGGVFAYANRAFLQRMGVAGLAELVPIPLLDFASRASHDELRSHLVAAQRLPPHSTERIQTRLTMLSQRGEYFEASCISSAIEFEGEQCVRFELRPQSPRTALAFLKSRPWALYLSVAFLLVFLLLPPWLLQHLAINNAPNVYFAPGEEAVQVDARVRQTFPSDQVAVLMFDGVALFSDGFLEAFDHLAQELRADPRIRDVFSVTTVNHISGSEDGFEVGPLIDVEALDETRPRDRAQLALSDRFARGALVAKDGSALSMVVVPVAVDDSLERLALLRDIEAAVAAARLGGYLVAVSGEVPGDVAQLQAMLHNNMIFIPVITLIGLALVWWLFRRPLAVVAAGISLGVVASTTISLFVVFGWPFTMVGSIIPPLLSALTVAALVHLFNGLHYSAQRGHVGAERVRQALAEIRKPSLFCHLTTIAGLASLGTSPIPPVAQFGFVAAIGVGLIFLVVIVLMPQIFARWDHAPWPRQRGGLQWMDRVVRVVAVIGMRYPLRVLAVVVVLIGVALPQILAVRVETSILEYFAKEHPYRHSTELIEERLVGTMPIDVVFESEEPEAVLDSAALARIAEFQHWALEQPEIDRSISPVDFIEEMNWAFNEEDPAARHIPDDAELISQYLLVYDGDELGDFLDEEHRQARVALNLNVHEANHISAVIKRMRAWLDAHPIDAVQVEIAGVGRLFADMEHLLLISQFYSLLTSLLIIFLMLWILLRRFGDALVAMLPNLPPVLSIFVAMGALGIWLDMASVMIASIAIGIGVDDTIHLYHGVRHRLLQGSPISVALMRTYRHAGRAVITTTLILSSQFLVLISSEFVPFRKFGFLAALAVCVALLFDMLVLPALLMLVYGRRRRLPKAGGG